jgi:hypothetical protein
MSKRRSRCAVAFAAAAVVLVGLCSAEISSAQSPRRVFVTSVEGNGDLATWPDSGGTDGLAGADAVCQSRAQAAGLPNPSGFVAWLSDSSNDAYCRVHGLTGLKSINCGLPTLPVAAGPWVRVDGFAFAGRIDEMLEPRQWVLTSVRFDEFGGVGSRSYFTATLQDGELPDHTPNACSDWTSSTSEIVVVGDPERTSQSWTYLGTGSCSQERPLLCMEIGAASALPPYHSGGALAFVTSADGTGNLGSWPESGGASGIAAGDAICRALATNAGLDEPMSFKAWLSDGTTNAVDRFSYNGPWIRPDGVKVADNKTDLTDGALWTSISVAEDGAYWHNHRGWTGTSISGGNTGNNCLDWTSTSDVDLGTEAFINAADERWTDNFQVGCDRTYYHLYCLSEVPTVIFVDGFESGDTAAWSNTVP